jgi:hypothetical protein
MEWERKVSEHAARLLEAYLNQHYPEDEQRRDVKRLFEDDVARFMEFYGMTSNYLQFIGRHHRDPCTVLRFIEENPHVLRMVGKVQSTHPWDVCRETALGHALYHSSQDMFRFLMELGVDPNIGRQHPVYLAIYTKNVDMALKLLRHPNCTFIRRPPVSIFASERIDSPLSPSRCFVYGRISVFWMLVHGVRLPKVPWLPRDCFRLLIGFL